MEQQEEDTRLLAITLSGVVDCQEHRHDDTGEEAKETGKALADPTIGQVLDEFMEEQRSRLKSGTLRKYEYVIELGRSKTFFRKTSSWLREIVTEDKAASCP